MKNKTSWLSWALVALLLAAGAVWAGPGDVKRVKFIWQPHEEPEVWFNLYWSPTVVGTMEDPDESATTWTKVATIPAGVHEYVLPVDEAAQAGFFALTAENERGESFFSNGAWVKAAPATSPVNLTIQLLAP